uniref:Uncharacterized protein n=1 Tax=Lepeophtheirus salmonis TaxID=72036 RepID=A0A0K2TMB6_LEPSM
MTFWNNPSRRSAAISILFSYFVLMVATETMFFLVMDC